MTRLWQVVAWFAFCLMLVVVVFKAERWHLVAASLAVTVVASVLRGGPRVFAFTVSFSVGAFGLLVHLFLGATMLPVGEGGRLIAFLPEWSLGPGVSVGGPYTVQQLELSAQRGLEVLTLCAILGLVWQACSAQDWCAFARIIFGRGSQLFAPVLCLGEAIVMTKAPEFKGGRLLAVVEINRELAQSATHTSPAQARSAGRAVLATVLVLIFGYSAFYISSLGGMNIRMYDGNIVQLNAKTFVYTVLFLWFVVRLVVGRKQWPTVQGVMPRSTAAAVGSQQRSVV